jgi:hypothetical protein
MNNIIRLLPKLLDAAGGNPEVAESAAKIAWNRGVGEALRANAVPLRFHQNTLVVAVADAIWQKQLQTMSSELLARINWVLDRDLIKFIEFRVDASIARARLASQPNKTGFAQGAPNAVTPEVMSAAATIQDESLRQHFLLAAAAAAAREQMKAGAQSQI